MSEFDNMKMFVKDAWPAREHIVPCLLGLPGIGKTAAVKEAAAELKAEGLATGKVVTIIASQILPNEVSGITMPVAESKAMEIFDHFRLGSLEDGDILFFDELLEAEQLVLSACLTLIESRELMSGRKLPDVMIVAATNPTIKPSMLKLNIRQRFVWRSFGIDSGGCLAYLKDRFGLKLPSNLLQPTSENENRYNILTPRSLTKMVAWMCSAGNEEEARRISVQIDRIWDSMLGTEIFKSWLDMHNSPEEQVRRKVKEIILDHGIDTGGETFEDCSIAEMMQVLCNLPEWSEIEKELSSATIRR